MQNPSIYNRIFHNEKKILESEGFSITRNIGKYGRIKYSHQERDFELYQLRLMVDAILSARFIPNNTKSEIIQKLKQLTSKHQAKTLPEPIMFSRSEERRVGK